MTLGFMVKYRQMKLLAMVMLLILAAAACSAAQLSVDDLPEPVRPHAEVETNVSFNAGATSDNLWRLSIALENDGDQCESKVTVDALELRVG